MNTKKNNSTFKKYSKKLLNKVKDPLKSCIITNLMFKSNKFQLSDLKKLIGTSKTISNNTKALFRSDKNKNYLDNYLKKYIIKYAKQNRTNLNNSITIIKCMGDNIGSLYSLFNKIFNYDYVEDSEELKQFIKYKYKKKENIYDKSPTEQLELFKNEFPKLAISYIIEFLIETFILSCANYEVHIRKSNGKQSVIKNGVESFLKELDVSIESNKKQLNTKYGKTYFLYNSIIEILLGQPQGISEREKQNLTKDKLYQMKNNKIVEIKNHLTILFSKNDTKERMQNMATEQVLKKNEEKDKLRDLAFDENQSSSFLFIIIGLLGFALLTKFNVFAPSTNIGTGFA